ncbi:MAG TPA: hypothetical protein VMN76_05100 [Acidobacteriota bacterium]|nr:hypothetical protein [Acidobacteriota bacterium]
MFKGVPLHGFFRTLVLVAFFACFGPLSGADFRWGGSIRGYQFFRVEDLAGDQRRDAELAIARLTGRLGLAGSWRFEGHGTLTFLSPPAAGVASLADARGSEFFKLQTMLADGESATLLAAFDRLNLQGDVGSARLAVGRQSITWGVNHFWPSLDLFSPFAPQRIDRDYKPGVDAVRLILPLGPFSQVEAVGAILGSSRSRDGALGVLTRFHLGRVDAGLMAGSFHRDRVAGAFFTSDIGGTGFRGEAAWTESADPEDRLRDRRRFWRGSIGVDRMLTPHVTLTLEALWNGYGMSEPADYLQLIEADRVLRGEVNALGRYYAGASIGWQMHPLWTLNHAVLINGGDPSALWIPSASWSTSNETELLFGAQVGIGRGLEREAIPRSEYGAVPFSLFLSFKGYF